MHRQAHARPASTGRTMARETSGAAKGCLLTVLGFICWFPGLILLVGSISTGGGAAWIVPVGLVLVLIGVILTMYGEYTRKKARQVAWVREAIEAHEHETGPAVQIATPQVPSASAAPVGPDDVAKRLRQLQGLLDEGLITEDDFASRKAAILSEV